MKKFVGLRLQGFFQDSCDDEGFVMVMGINAGGGKGGGVVEKPVYVPPPVAPAVDEAATQESAVTPEEEMKRKREAVKQGTKSLQIPMTGGGTTAGSVGTGTTTP
jgi:hypothetical protein